MEYYLTPSACAPLLRSLDPGSIAWLFCPQCGFRDGTDTHTYAFTYLVTHVHTRAQESAHQHKKRTEKWPDLCVVLLLQRLYMMVQRKA